MRKQLGDRIRAARTKRGVLALRRLFRNSKHLGTRSLEKAGAGIDCPNCFEEIDGAKASRVGSKQRARERLRDETHARKVVDLVRVYLFDQVTAAFCVNDLLAIGMLQEFVTNGVRVPDDVAIIGYDDIAFASAAAIPLSSVRQPRNQLGRRAAELLIDEALSDDHVHSRLVFEPELIVRQSSR